MKFIMRSRFGKNLRWGLGFGQKSWYDLGFQILLHSSPLRNIRDALLTDTRAFSYSKVYASKVTLKNRVVYPMWETFNGTDPSEEQCGESRQHLRVT